jgi:hypothetical protein
MLQLLDCDTAVQVSLKFALPPPLLPPLCSARQRRPPEGLLVGYGGRQEHADSGGAAAVPAPAPQAGGAPSGRAAQPALLFSGSPRCRRCRTPPWPGRTGSCRARSWRWGACGRTPAAAAAPTGAVPGQTGSADGVLETRCSLACRPLVVMAGKSAHPSSTAVAPAHAGGVDRRRLADAPKARGCLVSQGLSRAPAARRRHRDAVSSPPGVGSLGAQGSRASGSPPLAFSLAQLSRPEARPAARR